MSRKTLLISAAVGAADETVALLLSKGASPDLQDMNGHTALMHAIVSQCSSTIGLLAPVKNNCLGDTLGNLALYQIEPTPAVQDFLKRATMDQDALRMGLVKAAQFGASSILKILTKDWNKNNVTPIDGNYLLEKALKSDNAETVEVVLAFVRDVSSENTVLALTRGRADVVELFGHGDDKKSIDTAKKNGLKL